jgi:hypothetical protein
VRLGQLPLRRPGSTRQFCPTTSSSPSRATTTTRSAYSTRASHEAWARATGTQLREIESGFRYTLTTCFETVPFPSPTDEQREAIAAAARELVRLRDGWLNPPDLDPAELSKRTLTNLYNTRPTWLEHAHAALDQAVLAAYSWPADLPVEDVLARLLALNFERDRA